MGEMETEFGWPIARNGRGWRLLLTGSIPAETDTERPIQGAMMREIQDAMMRLGERGVYLGRLAFYVAGRDTEDAHASENLLAQVGAELDRQGEQWGEQNHPLIRPGATKGVILATLYAAVDPADAKARVDAEARGGKSNWLSILTEELAEFAEQAWDAEALGIPGAVGRARTELIQVAAVATQAVGALDRAARRAEEEAIAADSATSDADLERLTPVVAATAVLEAGAAEGAGLADAPPEYFGGHERAEDSENPEQVIRD